jgi:hypothetical protein
MSIDDYVYEFKKQTRSLKVLAEDARSELSEAKTKIDIPRESKYGVYSGPDLEVGGTSINAAAAPALRDDVFKAGLLKKGDVILDYGAGKYARNANFLRDQGFKVFAYDPYNHNGKDGWEDGGVSSKLPTGVKFDVVFSSFVLNVLQNKTMIKLVKKMERLSTRLTIHITRNRDVFDGALKSIRGGSDKAILPFIEKYYPDKEMAVNLKEKNIDAITDEQIMDLSVFGYASSRGFQIIPMLDNYGYSKLREVNGYKLYVK